MTRINLVDPEALTDQHLLAEHRELPRIFPLARAAMERGDLSGPDRYTMGTGHVRFFYQRTGWLVARHRALTAECVRRGFRVQVGELVPLPGCVAWEPTAADVEVNLIRLRAKMAAPPREGFYRHCGKVVGADWYG
jgi:deoxyribonuclease (pyrimidine dimer)